MAVKLITGSHQALPLEFSSAKGKKVRILPVLN
jgi:hypothetical protein